jgi:tRNA 2-selenouridine synthase SelU
LLQDSERQRVGTCYKQEGQDAAIALGHRLVNGRLKQARIDAWLAWIDSHPGAWVNCFRGGLRSAITQQWLEEAGAACPRVPGGYKALRQFLVETIEQTSSKRRASGSAILIRIPANTKLSLRTRFRCKPAREPLRHRRQRQPLIRKKQSLRRRL